MTIEKEKGFLGERIARKYLKNRKLKYLYSNYVYKRGEIDLIFEDKKNQIIIFVEVKTRIDNKFGEPEESINNKKINNLIKSASGFLSENLKYKEHDIRFDSISVILSDNGPIINHTENIT